MSDPELVESNPGKHESCPILPCYPEPSESCVGPGAAGFFRRYGRLNRQCPGQFRDYGRLGRPESAGFCRHDRSWLMIDDPLLCPFSDEPYVT
jgi:hypothetical protein